jgi:hypothetical protein
MLSVGTNIFMGCFACQVFDLQCAHGVRGFARSLSHTLKADRALFKSPVKLKADSPESQDSCM